jgi:hypothetical protein
MAFISERWPFITPWNVETLPAYWWAYYVRAAELQIKKQQEAMKSGR